MVSNKTYWSLTKSIDRLNFINGIGTSKGKMLLAVGLVLNVGQVKPSSSDYFT